MTIEEKFCNLKDDVLSLLTDQNVNFVSTETEEEKFGALMAYSKAFKEVSKVFEKAGI